MAVVRFQCPRCNSLFVPPAGQTDLVDCPNCGALAMPAQPPPEESGPAPVLGNGSLADELEGADRPSGEVSLATALEGPGRTGGDISLATALAMAGPPRDEDTSDELPGGPPGGGPSELLPSPPSGVFASLMGPAPSTRVEDAPPPPPPLPAASAPEADTAVGPPPSGIFSSLLSSAADLELSGKRAPIQDRPAAAAPVAARPDPDVTAEEFLPPPRRTDDSASLPPLSPAQDPTDPDGEPVPRSGLRQETPLPDSGPDPFSQSITSPPALRPSAPAGPGFDVVNTAMVMGPVTDPLAGVPAPPPAQKLVLDRATFSDAAFEAVLGGSFAAAAPSAGAAPQLSEPPPPAEENWVVPGSSRPPPLRKPPPAGVGGPPPLSVPPPAAPPPLKAKPDARSPAAVLGPLSPIPSVESLGEPPRLRDGFTVGRMVGLAVAALLLGSVGAWVDQPDPPKPPQSGPDGALHQLRQARKLMAQGRDDEAIPVLQAALAMDATLAEAQRDLGVAYARLQKMEEAARAYEHYLELAPKTADGPEVEATLRRYRAGR